MRKMKIGLVALGVFALVVLAVVMMSGQRPADDTQLDRPTVPASRLIRSQKPFVPRRPDGMTLASEKATDEAGTPTVSKENREKPVLSDSDEDEENEDGTLRTPEEKALMKRIESALDDEKLSEALACAPEALKCRVPEIRQAMVDTLGWFGKKSLPELTPFLADPDEDVCESAMNEWTSAVADIDDEAEKIGTVEMAMKVLTDEDALDDISSEYIGVDEKLAVESLLRIIEGGGSANGIAKASETYEFVTGDEFEGRAAAEKWIAEEYEPPDAD